MSGASVLLSGDLLTLWFCCRRQTLNARMDCPICSTSDGFPLSVLRSEWPIHERSKHHRRAVRVRELAAKGPDPYAEVRAEAARRKAEREKKRSEDDS